jgi:hypothetical protein
LLIGSLDTGTTEGFAELKAEMYLDEEENANGRMEVVFMQRAGTETNSDAGVGSDAVMRGSACLIAGSVRVRFRRDRSSKHYSNSVPLSKPCLYASRSLPCFYIIAVALDLHVIQ